MGKPRLARRELMPLARTQIKLVVVVCLPIVVTCVVVSVLQPYFFITSVQRDMAARSELTREVASTSLLIAVITLLVLAPVCVLLAVWVSHRIVGPMRRMEARLRAMAEGRIGRGFHFRQGDELPFVAEALASLEAVLIERIQAARNAENQEAMRSELEFFQLPGVEAPDAETADQGAA